ncbi:MAG TPA: acylase [Cytophagales bacterium]|jgi:acyl-homoserine-lactone acylase|nr:acylase [Cytophagales bacterium]
MISNPLKATYFLVLLTSVCYAQRFSTQESTAWKKQAADVSIIRDNYGVPHIYGKTDADAVFGMLYAQCEDDFERVERNYINASARMAEVEGESFIYQDLRMRLFLDSTKAIAFYNQSPAGLRKLCIAFADGVNYFLYTHPQVKPRLLKRFQPWMPFLFSEGSIGSNIESINVNELKEFYGKSPGNILEEKSDDGKMEPGGSNGIAIAPSITSSGNGMLLINPHTSFYFRTEQHVVSEEGLNVYGASTWGQFFIYQGFNEHCGWMHSSSEADVMDEYMEKIINRNNELIYKYGNEERKVNGKRISISYKDGNKLKQKEFTAFFTHHGPIIAQRNGKWISIKLMNDPVNALIQSFTRTKANSLDDFKKVMELKTNSSNNTTYADDQGNIAYWHGNFMPMRDVKFDWSKPVDGSNPETEWKGLHKTSEMIVVVNPKNGWLQNCNATPFTVAGENSPKKNDFPSYMAPDPENARGLHAVRVLKDQKDFTLEKLIAVSRDPYLPGFEKLISAFQKVDSTEFRARPFEYLLPFRLITKWDLRWSAQSVSTTLAIAWANRLRAKASERMPAGLSQLEEIQFMADQTSEQEKVDAFKETLTELIHEFGTWRMPWGEVNRYQRITGNIEPIFDDKKPSIAVPFTSSYWGSLAAYGSRKYPNTKKLYGTRGNSFIAVVEFGKRLKAKSITTGGASGNPDSPHFTDQAQMYCDGEFKDVLFYKEDLMKNVERSYRPGE